MIVRSRRLPPGWGAATPNESAPKNKVGGEPELPKSMGRVPRPRKKQLSAFGYLPPAQGTVRRALRRPGVYLTQR